jgi:hypothetical protein
MAPPPDAVSPAFEHLLYYGNLRQLTEEELARAVRIDPDQIPGLGPSLDAFREVLLERKRKILATYETDRVQEDARQGYQEIAVLLRPPKALTGPFREAARDEQLQDLERIWYRVKIHVILSPEISIDSWMLSATNTESTNSRRSMPSRAGRR